MAIDWGTALTTICGSGIVTWAVNYFLGPSQERRIARFRLLEARAIEAADALIIAFDKARSAVADAVFWNEYSDYDGEGAGIDADHALQAFETALRIHGPLLDDATEDTFTRAYQWLFSTLRDGQRDFDDFDNSTREHLNEIKACVRGERRSGTDARSREKRQRPPLPQSKVHRLPADLPASEVPTVTMIETVGDDRAAEEAEDVDRASQGSGRA